MNLNYISLRDISKAFSYFDTSKPLLCDSETDGLYGKIRLWQMYQQGCEHAVLLESPDVFQLINRLNDFNLIFHNAHYDITTIQQNSGTRWIPPRFEDTFLLARLHFCDKLEFSLDKVMSYVHGFDPYTKAKLDKKVLQKSKWGQLLTPKQYLYAAIDVLGLPEVYEAVSVKLDDINYKLDKLTLKYCLDFQWNGMPISREKLYNRYQENLEQVDTLNVPINVNSYKQVREYLDTEESDGLALARMAIEGNAKADAVQVTRKLIKENSFINKFDASVDDRIYGKFKPTARSGRLTSDDQNLQQIPRSLKSGFEAPEGRVLVYADYAQLELRTICAITVCKLMEEKFRDGVDLHGFTTEQLFGSGWTKEQRQLTKTYNFNLLYGGGVAMVISILIKQANVLLSEMQASRDKRRWKNLWKEISGWQEKRTNDWRKGKLNSTPLGRKYKSKLLTDHMNIENQGAGAEVAKLALHYFFPKLKEKFVDALLCNFIHDSFITECDDNPEEYQAIARLKAESMQLAWFEMSKLFGIKDLPMPVDVKVGKNWGDLEADKNIIWDYTLGPYEMLEEANAEV